MWPSTGPPPALIGTAERGLLRLAFDAIALACKHPSARNLWVDIHPDGPLVIRIEEMTGRARRATRV